MVVVEVQLKSNTNLFMVDGDGDYTRILSGNFVAFDEKIPEWETRIFGIYFLFSQFFSQGADNFGNSSFLRGCCFGQNSTF